MANLTMLWSQADGYKKTGIVAGMALIAVFTVGAMFWLVRTDYQVLFSGMDTRDAATVVSELERMKVDYRLEEAGTRIVVPGDVVHQVRLKLMGAEVPIAGTIGLEIFNDSDFGMTEFAQKINFQRALQGELTRTIMSLESVKYARVHLVMPESGLFKSEGKEPSASVTLFLKNSETPDARQIEGIQRLVASAVPELDAQMVTVSDQKGQTLSKPRTDAMGMAAISNRLQKQREVETYYSDKIMRLLESRFGDRDISVSVNATLSYDQVRVTREGVMGPDGSISSGVRRRRESSFGAASRSDKDGDNTTTEVEYELGHQVEQVVEAPGRLLRINVGVLVASTVSDELKGQIEELVAMAVGFDAARGDAIAVYSSADRTVTKATELAMATSGVQMMNETVPVEPVEITNEVVVDESAGVRGVIAALRADPVLLSLIGGAFFIGIGLMLWLSASLRKPRNIPAPAVLTQSEREQVLVQVQDWLRIEEPAQKADEARA